MHKLWCMQRILFFVSLLFFFFSSCDWYRSDKTAQVGTYLRNYGIILVMREFGWICQDYLWWNFADRKGMRNVAGTSSYQDNGKIVGLLLSDSAFTPFCTFDSIRFTPSLI